MKWLDGLKAIAMVVMCLTIAAAAGRTLVRPAPPDGPVVMPPAPYGAGEKVEPIPGVPDGRYRTLLMVVSSSCRFCTESMPFYRRLVASRQSEGLDVQIVALYVASDTEESVRRYFEAFDIIPDRILPFSMKHLNRIAGTPSLVLLDASNTVIGSWRGKLNRAAEEDVIAAIGS